MTKQNEYPTSPRDAKYQQLSKRTLIFMLVDCEVAIEVMRSALDHAKARLEEDGCDCGDANDPPCALCHVVVALDPETAKAIGESEQVLAEREKGGA